MSAEESERAIEYARATTRRRATESTGLRRGEELQWQELEELQQLLVMPLVSEEGSPNQYVRLASFERSCFVRAHFMFTPSNYLHPTVRPLPARESGIF
jgi:hypothetical protein